MCEWSGCSTKVGVVGRVFCAVHHQIHRYRTDPEYREAVLAEARARRKTTPKPKGPNRKKRPCGWVEVPNGPACETMAYVGGWCGVHERRSKYRTDPEFRQRAIDKAQAYFMDKYNNDEAFREREKAKCRERRRAKKRAK